MLSAALIVLLMLVCPAAAHAQSASVTGVVLDSSGAAVPAAHVVLRNTATNVEQATISGNQGSYSLINVLPGNYVLEVTKTGFQVARVVNIALAVSQAAVFNVKLTVGGVQETVTVTSETSAVQTSSATLGTVIGAKSVTDLPLNGRNFTELLELTPGVSRINTDQSAGGGSGVSGNAVGEFTLPAVNGQRNRSNMFLLDGANDLGSFFGNYNYQPIVDDIYEFKVISHEDLAEYGQVTGGVVAVATKSGTNRLHGSLWEFLRNAKTDARNYFATQVNPLHQNQFGVSVGGPVYIPHVYHGENKTFFFFAYEGFRQSQAAQSLLTTPTSAQLGGDFSNLLANGITLYNPFSTRPDPANPGEYIRDAFPNNQIPSNLLNSVAILYAQKLFPAPNTSGLAGGANVLDNSPTMLDMDSYTGRIDQSFGGRDQLFGRVSYYHEPATNSIFPGLTHSDVTQGWNIVVHEAHTFGPKSILEFTFARNVGTSLGSYSFDNAPSGFVNTLLTDGFSSQFLTGYGPQHQSFIPLMLISGYLGTSDNNYAGHQISDTYEYGGAFTKIVGRHTFKAGGSLASNNQQIPLEGANETFGSFQTSNLENPNGSLGSGSGNALASFELGVPSGATTENVDIIERHGQVDDAYLQDQFQATSKLTINAGVRWDVSIWPSHGADFANGQGYFGDIDLNNGTYIITAQPPACSATVGAPCIPGGALPAHVVVTTNRNLNLHSTDFSDWQPRLGLAYQALDKLSVTAGYARVYDEWGNITEATQAVEGNWPSTGFVRTVNFNLTTPDYIITDPLAQGSAAISQPAPNPFGQEQYYFNPNGKSPYSDQWNLGVNQGFGRNAVLSLAYVGSHNGHLNLAGLKNTATYAAPGTPAQVMAREPYPYMIPMYYDSQEGRSSYNALQTSLQERAWHGLTYLLSYTWSKSLDIGCSTAYAACYTQDPSNLNSSRGVSDYDLTDMFSAAVVDELPFGHGRTFNINNRLVDAVAGGWSINGVATLTSGTPYTVIVPGDIANIGNSFVLAEEIGNPRLARPTPQKWFNTSALISPARYHFGNFQKNSLRSDAFKDLDLSVFKSFSLPESAKFELRAEAFNATNSVVFGTPDGTVGDPNFGVVFSQANAPRVLQFAARIEF